MRRNRKHTHTHTQVKVIFFKIVLNEDKPASKRMTKVDDSSMKNRFNVIN